MDLINTTNGITIHLSKEEALMIQHRWPEHGPQDGWVPEYQQDLEQNSKLFTYICNQVFYNNTLFRVKKENIAGYKRQLEREAKGKLS